MGDDGCVARRTNGVILAASELLSRKDASKYQRHNERSHTSGCLCEKSDNPIIKVPNNQSMERTNKPFNFKEL
jgi:hypothetical protein